MQHRDFVGDVLDEFHVVLDHQHRALFDDAVEQLCGLGALGNAHTGDRLIEHQQIRVLNQQHADLEPLLLAMTQLVGINIQPVLQEDHLGDFLDTILDRGIALESERAEHRPAARIGNLEILEHRQVFVDRWGLELAPDPGLHDLVLLQFRELLAAKLNRS